jgi:hypothetical protein
MRAFESYAGADGTYVHVDGSYVDAVGIRVRADETAAHADGTCVGQDDSCARVNTTYVRADRTCVRVVGTTERTVGAVLAENQAFAGKIGGKGLREHSTAGFLRLTRQSGGQVKLVVNQKICADIRNARVM